MRPAVLSSGGAARTLTGADDAVHGLVAPDAVMPVQMNVGRSRAELSPECRLMLAVLEDAIAVYAKGLRGRGVSQRESHEVRLWLASRSRAPLFSFERICEVLQLDAEYLRRGLGALRHGNPAGVSALLARRHRGRLPGPVADRSRWRRRGGRAGRTAGGRKWDGSGVASRSGTGV